MPGADEWGKVKYGNSPATQDTKGSGNTSRGEEMASRQDLAAPQIPQRGTADEYIGEVSTQRHPDSADGVKPKHGALACREYSLLAPEELAGNPATAGDQGGGEIPGDTTGTGGTYGREMGKG